MLSHPQLFKSFVSDLDLFKPSERVLLAVSGGKDSVAMVHLFAEAGFKFAIAHCNFQLRGEESLRDELFVEALADKFGVPFHLSRFKTGEVAEEKGISIQMAARELRYNYFEALIEEYGYGKIATAHHQNDAIETLILNLIRGTGLAGLHGIRAKSDKLIRPLMCFDSSDIQTYAEQTSMAYVEDSSNSSIKYTRNKIRHQVLPLMKEINPSLEETLMANIRHFADTEDFVREQLACIKTEILEPDSSGYRLSLEKIRKLNSKHFIMREILEPFGFNETSISDLLTCIVNGAEPGRLFYSPTHILNLDRDFLLLSTRTGEEAVPELQIERESTEVIFGDCSIHIKEGELEKRGKAWCFTDADKLVFPLTIRNWRQGDVFVPLGMNGKKKLSDFFINQKIPVSAKKNIPVLVNGDGNIIWIVGYRPDERFKVTSRTKKIITFEKRM